MDLYPFKFSPSGPFLFVIAVGVFGLVLNLAFNMLLVFLLAYAAAKGWAAAS